MSIFQVLGREEQIQESLAIRERVLENFHSSIFDSVRLLVVVLQAHGEYEEARR